MSIRQIMKEKKIGFTKAKNIFLEEGNIIRKGRPPVEINENQYNFIQEYRKEFRVGFQRLYDVARRNPNAPPDLTEWTIRKVYEFDDLFVKGGGYHENTKHQNRYVARYANQAWHTDLHYLTPLKSENYFQAYLIVFIDDRTRKILYAEILPYKSSYCTSRALKTALEINDPPKYIITDNGKEFISQDFLIY